jgi:MFS family permease
MGTELNPAQRRDRPGSWQIAGPFSWYVVCANAVFGRGVFVLFLIHQGFSGAQIGVLQAVLYIGIAVADVPTGFLADRMGRRTSVAVGQVLLAGGLAGQLAAGHDFGAFIGLFVAQALGFAFVSGAESALLYDYLRLRGTTDSYVRIRARYNSLGAGVMAAAIVVGGLLQQISWQLVYLASAAAMLLAAVVLVARIPEIRGHRNGKA